MRKFLIGFFVGVRIFSKFFLYSIGWTDAMKKIDKEYPTNKNQGAKNSISKNRGCSFEHWSDEHHEK